MARGRCGDYFWADELIGVDKVDIAPINPHQPISTFTNVKKKLVLKIGSSTLTRGTSQVSRGKLEDLARQVLNLREQFDVVIVSSGAIATARQSVELDGGNSIEVKQALAAIGQPVLMRLYQEAFGDFGLRTAQCLLQSTDMNNETSRRNILNTLEVLLENGYVPIVNENDTVATEEIRFGDNDKLAAYTAVLIGADLLLLASDIDGLYDQNPKQIPHAQLIPTVSNLDEVMHLAADTDSALGTGGMRSKLQAARICTESGVEMWIVNGQVDGFAEKALAGEIRGTKFKLVQSSLKV